MPRPQLTRTPRSRPGRRRRPRAFTLVELVLVVIAVGVLSAIAVPRYSGAVSRYRVAIAAKRVVADLALARAAARSNGASILVDFSTPSNGYTLGGVPAPDGKAGDYTVRLSDEPYKVKIASASFGTGPSAGTGVYFTRYGTPEKNGTVVVSSGDFSKTVLLDAVTGRAEVR
jgi:prepilin-type N-terminal cleavage/methylation domain-containing protein